MRKRRGIAKHTFTPVNWAVECPLHAGEKRIEYPVGNGPAGTKTEYAIGLFYCPQDGGHTFNLEDAKVTTYNNDGSIAGSGLSLLNTVLLP